MKSIFILIILLEPYSKFQAVSTVEFNSLESCLKAREAIIREYNDLETFMTNNPFAQNKHTIRCVDTGIVE